MVYSVYTVLNTNTVVATVFAYHQFRFHDPIAFFVMVTSSVHKLSSSIVQTVSERESKIKVEVGTV